MFKVNDTNGHISHLGHVWTYFTSCSSVSIFKFEQVNVGWKKRILIWNKLKSQLRGDNRKDKNENC